MQNTPNKDSIMGFDPFGGELFGSIGSGRAGAKWQSVNIETTNVRRHGSELYDLRSQRPQPEAPAPVRDEIEEIAAALEEAVMERAAEKAVLAEEYVQPEQEPQEIPEVCEPAAEMTEESYAEETYLEAAPEELPEEVIEENLEAEESFEPVAEEMVEIAAEETFEPVAEETFEPSDEIIPELEAEEILEFEAEAAIEPVACEETEPAVCEICADAEEEIFDSSAEETFEPELIEDAPAAEGEIFFEDEPAAEAEETVFAETEEVFEDGVAEEDLCLEEASLQQNDEELCTESDTEPVAAELEGEGFVAEAEALEVSDAEYLADGEEPEMAEPEECEDAPEAALILAHKTMSIDRQLIKAGAVAAEPEAKSLPEKKSRKSRSGGARSIIFSAAFRRIGAAVALFALVVGSLAYYGSLIKYSGAPDPGSVAYLSMADHVRRTSADAGVTFLGENEVRQLFLTGSSAERDLNLVVTDITGAQVTGTAFQFKVIAPDGSESFHIDEDMDGQLSIEDLDEGEYGVEMLDAEGFIMPGAIAVTVAGSIEYVKIENISEIIVNQDDIDLEKEDMMAGGGRQEEETPPPVTTPTNTDTVEYVETRTEEVSVEKTRTVTKFRGNIDSASGRLYYADGTLSNVVPKVDANGYLTGEYSIFAEKYTITVNATEGGTASADATTSEAFNTVNLTATPADGYKFSGWSVGSAAAEFGDATAASTTLRVPAENVTVTANFEIISAPAPEYTLTIAASEGGTASADGGTTVSGKAGAEISITAIPANGYVFTGWSCSAGSVTDPAGASTVFTMPEGGATVTANFAADTTGGAMGGDINLFAKDAAGKYIYGITAEQVEEKYTEKTTKLYGWQTIDGKTYFYDKDGNKVVGTQKIKGVSYIFGADGALAKSEAVLGIDVSTWQPDIDWAAVKNSGVEYVIIRCGFRGYGSGKIVKDDCFDKHIRGAKAAGLKVGVYFFSQAINTTEAVEEASAVIEMVKGYSVDYPLVIDMEDAGAAGARTNGLTRSELTKIAIAFGETCRSSGYSAMIYANKYWLESKLDTSQLGNYYIWLAHYTGGTASSYKGRYEMWQYTSVGRVPGISGNVDMNYSYMG